MRTDGKLRWGADLHSPLGSWLLLVLVISSHPDMAWGLGSRDGRGGGWSTGRGMETLEGMVSSPFKSWEEVLLSKETQGSEDLQAS